ncbi:MAG: ferrous iron transport protein A [Oscillochloris sp.]|nr:ferrous iron transport protein A [Oscillochloris sp.]
MNQPIRSTLPLAMAGEGARVRMIGMSGTQRVAHRLAELGLTTGAAMKVLRDNGGTLLIAVGDTRLALGSSVAHTVLVSLLD